VLEVVEQEENAASGEDGRQPVERRCCVRHPDAKCLRDGDRQQFAVPDGRQRNKGGTVGEAACGDERCPGSERQAGLSDAWRAGQRRKSDLRTAEKAGDGRGLILAADQGGQGRRKRPGPNARQADGRRA
jgi:hypothetical protein